MLKSISVHNYRSFIDFTTDLPQQVVLVGSSGSGKTSIFEVLQGLVSIIVHSARVADVFPTKTLTYGQISDRQRFSIVLGSYTYTLELIHDMGRKTPEILSERLSVADGRIIYQLVDGEVQIYDDCQRVQTCFHFNRRGSFIPHLEQNHDNLQLVQFREALGDIVLFAPNPSALKSVTSSEAQELDTNGRNFASWFRGILVGDSESGVELNRLLRLALPGAQRLHYEIISSSVREVRLAFQSRHQTVDIPIDELSTGQRAAILMFGFLAGTRIKQPRVVFIDRPETDLDPHTTEFMLSYIKDSYNNCQVILGSNQQTIFDSASEVLWLSRPDGGHTQVSKTQQ